MNTDDLERGREAAVSCYLAAVDQTRSIPIFHPMLN